MPRLALLVLLVSPAIVAACASARPVLPPPPACSHRVPLAAPSSRPAQAETLAFPPALEDQACRIAGPRATLDVTVEVDGDTFPVMVRGAPVIVVPGSAPASTVEVEGALAFVGRVEDLVFFPATTVDVADGMVELGPQTVLQGTAPREDQLLARTIDIGGDLSLSDLGVPCAALTFLGSGDPREEQYVRGPHAPLRAPACGDPCVYYETPATVDVFARPGGGTRVRLRGGRTFVAGLERSGRWTRIATVDDVHLGAQITGWVEHGRLVPLKGGIGFSGNLYRAAPLPAGSGHLGWRSGPGVLHGMVHADAGTPVFTSRVGGTRWARVRDRDAELEAVLEPGSPRARLLSAPSLPVLVNAWVPVGAVHGLPAMLAPAPGDGTTSKKPGEAP